MKALTNIELQNFTAETIILPLILWVVVFATRHFDLQ